jgi:hypothetical protein
VHSGAACKAAVSRTRCQGVFSSNYLPPATILPFNLPLRGSRWRFSIQLASDLSGGRDGGVRFNQKACNCGYCGSSCCRFLPSGHFTTVCIQDIFLSTRLFSNDGLGHKYLSRDVGFSCLQRGPQVSYVAVSSRPRYTYSINRCLIVWRFLITKASLRTPLPRPSLPTLFSH